MPNIGLYVWAVIAVAAAGFILLGVAVTAAKRRARTEQLQILFGPEYDRAVRLYEDKNRAEAALESRRRRLEGFGVHELSDSDRDRFLMEWARIQSASPVSSGTTLIQADALLARIMEAEGCPVEDDDDRKIDLALVHPTIAEEYRVASDVIARNSLGLATPEESRRAVIRFSNIFDTILGESDLRQRLRRAS
jgi:hypothetical protein